MLWQRCRNWHSSSKIVKSCYDRKWNWQRILQFNQLSVSVSWLSIFINIMALHKNLISNFAIAAATLCLQHFLFLGRKMHAKCFMPLHYMPQNNCCLLDANLTVQEITTAACWLWYEVRRKYFALQLSSYFGKHLQS